MLSIALSASNFLSPDGFKLSTASSIAFCNFLEPPNNFKSFKPEPN